MKEEKKTNSEEVNNLLSKTLKNTSSMFILSIITKIVTLLCNVIIVRKITKNSFGIVKIYFEFAFSLIIFFPCETLRKSAQKYIPDENKENEKKKYEIIVQLYSIIILIMLIFSIILYFSFLYFGGENISLNKTQLLIYILSALIELLSEPIIIYMNLYLENKQIAISIGNFSRVIFNVFFAAILNLDIWSFTLSRIISSIFYSSFLIYKGIFIYKINYSKLFFGNFKEILTKDKIDNIDVTSAREILYTFIKATGLKMILNYCEQIILSFVIKQSNEEKGEYSFIIENFSFIIRFLLEPIEETFYNLINKIKKIEIKDKNKSIESNDKSLTFNILKLFIKLLLIFDTLLISYVFLSGKDIIQIIYSKKWATLSTEKIGKIQSIYIAIISINGIIESFANATNNTNQMNNYNFLMIFNSIFLIIFMNFFSKFDICGLIMANALSMIIRINGNLYIIFSGREQVKEYQKDICNFKVDIFKFWKDFYLCIPSLISTILCILFGYQIKYFLRNKSVFYSVGVCGFIGLINIGLLYIFENKNIRRDLKKMKTD